MGKSAVHGMPRASHIWGLVVDAPPLGALFFQGQWPPPAGAAPMGLSAVNSDLLND